MIEDSDILKLVEQKLFQAEYKTCGCFVADHLLRSSCPWHPGNYVKRWRWKVAAPFTKFKDGKRKKGRPPQSRKSV